MNVEMRSYLLQKRLEKQFAQKLRRQYAEALKTKLFRNRKLGRVHPYQHMSNDFFDRSFLH